MTRPYFSLAMVLALASAGCAKNQSDQTQNPDGSDSGSGSVDGSDGSSEAQGPSRARSSTSARGVDRTTRARKVSAKKPPRGPVDDVPAGDDGPNGLLAEAFALTSPAALPDFASLGAPAQSFSLRTVDHDGSIPGLKLQDDFALRLSGSINILAEAEYELCLYSDDGSQLYLEDFLVVDNDGLHDEAVEACELVYLEAGEYGIEIRYFQAAGSNTTLFFAWAIDDGEKELVPAEVLFKP
jgi:hypothetical protein